MNARLETQSAAGRCSEIEDAIARGEMDAAQVFTQMQQLIGADDRILWGVVANAGRLSDKRKARWCHVSDATGQGSTYSSNLCRRFGRDPDEICGGHALAEGGAA